MPFFFDYITLAITLILCIKNRKVMFSSFVNIIYALFLIFYVFPLFIDIFYEIPPYSNHYDAAFAIPSLDVSTRLIYDVFILYAQILVLNFLRKEDVGTQQHHQNVSFPKWIIWPGMILPTFLTLVVLESPFMLYTYQWRELGLLNIEQYYWYVETFSYVGITCSVFLLLSRGNNKAERILALIFLYMNVCEQGKRAALFFALINVVLILCYNYVYTKQDHKKHIFSIFIISSIVLIVAQNMLSITFQVQTNRGYSEDISNMVEMTRVDFLRDDRVRYAIYDELNDDVNIQDYKGQTLLGDACNFFPMMYFVGKLDVAKYRYQNMLSTSMVGERVESSDKQHMTPCYIGELVSNLGLLLGLLLSPLIIIWFINKARKYPYPLNAFIVLCFALLNLFSVTYIAIFIEFTLALIYIYIGNNKTNKYEDSRLEF